MPGAKPGDLKFKDLNGDGKLDDEDRTMTGNPHPDFTFGLTLSAEYKGFDVSAFFQGSVGNDLLNVLKYDIYSGTGWYNAPKDILTTYWNGPGSTNKNFGIDADSRMNLEMSDWYVENGSYVRLKNLQIGYTIPSAITKRLRSITCVYSLLHKIYLLLPDIQDSIRKSGRSITILNTKDVIWDFIRSQEHLCLV